MYTRRDDSGTTRRWIQWILVLALAAMALTIAGGAPATAAPVDTVSKEQLQSDCEIAGGIFTERLDGGYSCWLWGLLIECDAGGSCLSWCYEAFGCPCDKHDIVICIGAFTPDEPSNPWDDTVHIDPDQEMKLPNQSGSGMNSPGSMTLPDRVIGGGEQVMKGTD